MLPGGLIWERLSLCASLKRAGIVVTWLTVNGSFSAKSTCSACKGKITRKSTVITVVSLG